MEKSKKIYLVELIVLTVISIFIGSLLFVTPFFGDINFIDEGQFAAWSYRMLLGKYLYKDIFVTYGPLYIYPLFVAFKFFGQSAFVTRIVVLTLNTLLGTIISYIALIFLGVSSWTRRIGTLVLLLLPGNTLRLGLGLLSILLLKKQTNWKMAFLLGFVVLLTFLTSPEIGIISFLFALGYFVYKGVAEKLAGFFGGVILFGAIFAFWATRQGWLVSYFLTTKDVLITFSGINTPNGMNFPNVFHIGLLSKDMLLYWEILFYVFLLLYCTVLWILKIREKNRLLVLLLSMYGILLFTILIGRPGHFFFTLPTAIILGSLVFDKLFRYISFKKFTFQSFIASGICIFLAFFVLRMVAIYRQNISLAPRAIASVLNPKGNPMFVGDIEISSSQKTYIASLQNFVWQNTKAHEKIFFLSDEPMMYMLVQRENSTRYDLPYEAITKGKRLEIVSDMEKNPPFYIFYDTSVWAVDGINNKMRLPEVWEYILKNYAKEKNLDSVEVYKNKEKVHS